MATSQPTKLFAVRPMWTLASACLIGLALGTPGAMAQGLLQQNPIIRLIVPYPPGGGDVLARMVAESLSEEIGRRIIIDNKPGADGLVAAELVKRSPPDGKTLFFATNTQMAGAPALQKVMPYDPTMDFTPVAMLGIAGFFLFSNSDIPAKSVPELVQHARRVGKDKPLACGTSNITSLFAMLQLTRSQNFDCTQVSYRGDGAALPAMATHEIDMLFATVTSAKAFLDGGQIRMLATTLPKRSPLYPDVPTLEEAGIPGIEVAPFMGFFGPPNMPKDITDELGLATQKVLSQPALRQRLTDQAVAVDGRPGEPLAKMVKEQLELAQRLVKDAKLPQQ